MALRGSVTALFHPCSSRVGTKDVFPPSESHALCQYELTPEPPAISKWPLSALSPSLIQSTLNFGLYLAPEKEMQRCMKFQVSVRDPVQRLNVG